MINRDTIKALRDAIEKCGGPGGKPGPCPGPRKPQAGKKPPKKPTKPEGPNGSYSREQLQAHNRQQQKPSKPPKAPGSKPPAKPKTLEEAVMPHFDEIQKSRKKVHQLALKLGFKPTSKDPDVAVQQAMEWAQVRAAKKVLGAEVGTTKPAKKPASTGKPVATETGKTKPPKDKKPPKNPGKQPTQAPAARKQKTVDGIENEAKSIIELSKSPETRRVDVGHPTIARLAGRSFSKIVQSLAGMKPSEIWPNRRQAAKNLAEKFRTEFTDEKVEARIQAVHAHVKKVFTKEGAAARIISNFLKEQPW